MSNEKIVPILNDFKAFVKDQALFFESDKLLLAISGGIDSVVLAHLLSLSGFHFSLAHCNFGLRGEDSDNDEAFVRQLAKVLGVEVFVEKMPAAELSEKEGISIQMAARKLRYHWFEGLLQDHGLDYLATAHHLDDSLETSIFNLTRGTGLKGLKGISPKSGNRVRPLMFLGRSEITEFAQSEGIQWREDSSNASDKYHRNLIRHQITPVLKQINPALSNTFRWSSHRLEAANYYFQQVLADFKEQHLVKKADDWYLDKNALMQKDYPDVLLSEMISVWNFNFFQAKEILDCLRTNPLSGKKFYSESHWLVIDRKHIIISELNSAIFDAINIEADFSEIKFGGKMIKMSETSGSEYTIDKDPLKVAFDAQTLKYPLKLRIWKQGDWFIPLGMRGKKKLSDFLIDSKVPLNQKKNQWVLCSGNDIVWVVGLRIDDRFKVLSHTQSIKILELTNLP